MGQPAIPISLNPSGAYSLGVKIGRRGLDAVLINFTGEILRRCAYDYAYPDPDFIFPTIRRAIQELTQDFSPVQAKRVLGIGVAAPYGLGGWQHEAGIPTPITTRWNSIDIKQTIQADRLTLPIPRNCKISPRVVLTSPVWSCSSTADRHSGQLRHQYRLLALTG